MGASFTTLASGSSGNAALIRSGSFGLLIDLGVGPRTLVRRLSDAGFHWGDIDAVALTHTHSDHWRETTLTHVAARGIPVFCHASHGEHLGRTSETFAELQQSGRVTTFQAREHVAPGGGLELLPLEVEHDSHRTFGFRIENREGNWALGYVADLGRYDDALLGMLSDLDLLALEFNHDEAMQRNSGRPRMLIDRVLGPKGHLSNCQAGQFVQTLLGRRANGRLTTLVPLHLSKDCNRFELVERSAKEALSWCGSSASVKVARRECACQPIPLGAIQSPKAGITRSLFDDLTCETISPAEGTSTPPWSR
jgi:phosphoribosyl 1,2-cyclic phosphodiesterase